MNLGIIIITSAGIIYTGNSKQRIPVLFEIFWDTLSQSLNSSKNNIEGIFQVKMLLT